MNAAGQMRGETKKQIVHPASDSKSGESVQKIRFAIFSRRKLPCAVFSGMISQMPTAPPILTATGVSFSYEKTPAVDQFDLMLECGEIVSLLGPNGSGKSTLLKLLLGHLRGAGTISWQQRDLWDWPRRELARLIAYLPQSPLIDDAQTVMELIRLGRAPYWPMFGLESPADVEIVDRVIDELGIERGLLRRRLDEVSGGQRQRIFIARCLVQQPRVLLLDEPTTFLDLGHQMQLLQLLGQLSREKQIAILMTSHDINLAGDFSDRLVLMNNGRKVAEGPGNAVLTPALLGEVYGVAMEKLNREDGGIVMAPRRPVSVK